MNRGNKNLILGGFILIILGLAGFGLPFILNFIYTGELPAGDVALADLPTFEEQFVEQSNQFPISSDTSNSQVGVDYERLDVSDRLIISKAGVNMPLFLGENERILNKGGWLFHKTSRPDLGSNSVIFGHRFKYLPPISNTLYNLDKVEIGDEMTVIWQGRKYTYRVFEVKIVEPNDLSVIQLTSDSRLTVITCTPLFTTKQRLVVVGSLM